MKFKLSEITTALDADLINEDRECDGISIDTRTLQPNNLYIAIKGPNHDGHDFIDDAVSKGASAILVSNETNNTISQLKVKDTRLALGQLTKWYRNQFTIPFIAITGSSGKTTTKEMIAMILSQKVPTLSTQGTLNNDYGVPLTLAKLTPEHQFAVIEMGANHSGEISYLADICKADVATITNVSPSHLSGFKTIEGVAKAKSEIFECLNDTGTTVLNRDDDFYDYWCEQLKNLPKENIITFGTNSSADVQARLLHVNENGCCRFTLKLPNQELTINLNVPGQHNIINAANAAATAFVLNIKPEQIKQGLENFGGVKGRLYICKGINNSCVIDDTYNANISSVTAALNVLANYQGQRIFVLGDMAELGDNPEQFHVQAGQYARELGINKLFTYGKLTQHTVKAFGDGAQHFDNHDDLINALSPHLNDGVTVLIKGSRSMKMETVLRAVVE